MPGLVALAGICGGVPGFAAPCLDWRLGSVVAWRSAAFSSFLVIVMLHDGVKV